MTQLTTYTYDRTREQQVKVLEIMDSGNYRPREVPYSLRAVEGDGFTATLYSRERHNTRKFCVQGSKAQDFILFQLADLFADLTKSFLSSFGFEEINVACLPDNEASRRTILANGGEYLETVFLEEDGVNLERYAIKL